MIEDHIHGPDGRVIVSEPEAAIPEVAETEQVEAVSNAEVEIAKIEADRDIKIASTETKRAETYADEELAELRGELRALRDIVDALKPSEPSEAEATPVVVETEPAAPPLDAPPPEETENRPERRKKGSDHFWFG